ncbi:MAG: bile acid:sodium symporter family protein [Bacteroidales bacterium]
MLKKIGIDWFILILIAAILFSYAFPSIGTEKSCLPIKTISYYGISLVFLLYGLKLNTREFFQDISNWKMHIIIQASTFVLFPVILLILKHFITNETLWLSLFYLAALPSTVSSSVIMVSLAHGNIPGAIFNATLSSLAGILITPAWMSLFMDTSTYNYNPGEIYTNLLFQIIIPICTGMLLQPILKKYIQPIKHKLKIIDQSVIIFIVYTSFSKSFANNIFSDYAPVTILSIFISITALFFGVFFMLYMISNTLNMSYKDRITIQFCGSQKSLLHGVAIANILFADSTIAGFILIPIMIYHVTQLLYTSIYAKQIISEK